MSRFPMRTFQQDAILKRLSEGLVALETTNIKTLSDSELNKLQCGDVVVKKTGQQEHAYVVTYKQDKHGICLTYSDASCVETQSYDYEHGHWAYNSQDVILLNKMENITDKDGHNRFIEGEIELETISGVSKEYGKWSLSGSHLLIVLMLNLDNTITITGNSRLCNINIPKWMFDKVSVVFSNLVTYGTATAYGSDSSSQNFGNYLTKGTSNLSIFKLNDITLTANRKVRIQYDLLIDNE